LPASKAAEFVGEVTSQLTPDQLGAGLATFFPFPTAPLRRPLFVVPRSEPRAFQLTLLRSPFPGAGIPGLLAQNRDFHDLAVRLGGKRYLIGAVPDTSTADWRRHEGALCPVFRVAKELYDPDGVLTPGQGIFT
jgi:cytokinin dehydrogenase